MHNCQCYAPVMLVPAILNGLIPRARPLPRPQVVRAAGIVPPALNATVAGNVAQGAVDEMQRLQDTRDLNIELWLSAIGITTGVVIGFIAERSSRGLGRRRPRRGRR